MKGDLVYNYMTNLLIFITIEFAVAIITQFYVPRDKTYEELSYPERFLTTLRFYLNIIEVIVVAYALVNFSKYLNLVTNIFLISILLACLRYFLFAAKFIYYFIDETKRNANIVDFMEGTFGIIQNLTIFFLLAFTVIRIYFSNVI